MFVFDWNTCDNTIVFKNTCETTQKHRDKFSMNEIPLAWNNSKLVDMLLKSVNHSFNHRNESLGVFVCRYFYIFAFNTFCSRSVVIRVKAVKASQ